jgi:Na+/melibiose symporter-like transporter
MSEPPGPGRRALVAYAALALPLAALNLPLYVYLPSFYAGEMGLELATVGAVLLAARLLDVVTDPILGELGDRTRSRFGQRRPWIAAGVPLLLVATWQLFVPPAGAGASHLLAWSFVAYLAWTAILLAYNAWGAELSGGYHERSRITAWRESFVILGIVVAAALPAVLGSEPGSGRTLATLFALMATALVVTAGLALLAVPEPERVRQTALPWRQGVAIAWANRPFRTLLVAYLLNGIANGLPATLFLLFVGHVLGAPDAAGPLLLLYFVSGIAAVPGWLWLSYRIGKARAWIVAMLWACAAFAATAFVGPGDLLLFTAICLASGLALGADLVLPPAMQADVVDLDRVRSGVRRTGLFFALWSMATKAALALAVGLAFPVLDRAGFDPAAAAQGAAALATLTALYALVPIAIKLVAALVMRGFDLDPARQQALRAEIAARHGTG